MIFVLLCLVGLGLAVWAIIGIWDLAYSWLGALCGSVGAFIGIGAVTLLCAFGGAHLAGWFAPAHVAHEYDTELRAVALGNGLDGSFFLGTGYIDGKRVINYIAQHDGYSTIEQVDAANAYIYEDEASDPYVTTHKWESFEWWVAPFPTDRGTAYSFHVPEGSVLENYTIDNAGGTQ